MDNKLKFPSWADSKIQRRSASRLVIQAHIGLLIGLLGVGIAITGCSSIVTDNTAPSSGSPFKASGLPYFLPKGFIHVTGNFGKAGDATTYAVAASATMMPDVSSGPYFARRDADYFSNDSMHLATTNGLLNSASATNNDATAQIVAAAASMIHLTALGVKPAAGPLTAFDITFDPSDDSDAKSKVHTDCGLILTVTPIGRDPTSSTTVPKESQGLLYRPLKAYEVDFEGTVIGGPNVKYIQYVLLPNPNVTYCVPFNRMPFSDMVTTVSFANGEPIAYSQDVPSPILGFASIPKDILQSILPIPAAATTGQGVTK